jgi:cytochrome P450
MSPTLPPGPRTPQAIQTLSWTVRPLPFLRDAHRRFGDVFTVRVEPTRPWVVLAHPDAVREVFTGDPDVLRAGEGNAVLRPVLGPNSVILLDGPRHLRQRRLMLPPFHGKRMQRYREVMREATERQLASWPDGKAFRLAPSMREITLDVICRAVFGVDEGARMTRLKTVLSRLADQTTGAVRTLVLSVLPIRNPRHVPGFGSLLDAVDEAVYDEIARRRQAAGLDERDDILSMLLQARDEDGEGMTDDELRDELLTLLFAGHETTATALSWCFERLLRHPGVLDRLRAEIEEEGDEGPYLDAVVKETLRLRPVVPIVVRCLAADTTIAGRELPAGACVVPSITLVHERPDIYPEPERFRPERFLEQPAGTYSWIPFGGGVRRCIGASFARFEMQVVLAGILRQVELKPDGGAERVTRRGITLVPERGGAVVAAR